MQKKFLVVAALAFIISLVACAGSPAGVGSSLKDGVYTASGMGYKGPINVSVEIAGGKILTLSIISHSDTPGISDAAIEGLPAAIIKKQSTKVDAIAGATGTSEGILEAVVKALEKARI